ncbi:MAG TPA: SPOR domain-containing protein [candidate division WOR-3 bacterium]|uniref:SPOR domain-containing protein n=1 Tax=candidate division WOR-3 bacterium TaxID=2052148 RepID=A0A9C9ENH0_UNCW3|nr:SPOR domain-containing protein [candidate division WOR-3 bacterium]
MWSLCIINFLVSLSFSPFIKDSIVYAVDIPTRTFMAQSLNGEIVDHCMDNFLYALTGRYLYKIDPDNLSVCDRIPLPQRFNHLTTNKEKIILISSEEIVLLNKTNFAFEAGIGIERGDYYPLVTSEGSSIVRHGSRIYLAIDSDKKSIIKIFDLSNGRLVKKSTLSRILDYRYDSKENQLTILGFNKKLTIYTLGLKKRKTLNLNFQATGFIKYDGGYLLHNKEGLFFIDESGRLIDFLPLLNQKKEELGKLLFLTEKGILSVDSLTLRPNFILKNSGKLKDILYVDYVNYALGVDDGGRFYLIGLKDRKIEPIMKRKPVVEEIKPVVSVKKSDSLWYFQLGAFNNYDNALKLFNELRQKNIPVFIDSTGLYRIKLGGFIKKDIGIEIIEKLQLNGWFIFQKKLIQYGTSRFYIGSEEYILKNGVITRRKI